MAKNEMWDITCSKINTELGFRRSREAWTILKKMRQQTSHIARIDLISMQDWYKFYSTLLTEDRTEFMEKEEWKMENPNLTVSDTDVDGVIRKMKNGKSPGPGNINMELIKYGGGKALTMVTKLINKILEGDNIPQEMKTGYLIQIHKKGDKRKCGNYRGINIMNLFMKILGHLIKNWIENHCKGNEQSGFTKGRSTADHIFTL
jgi:hypothetical protein